MILAFKLAVRNLLGAGFRSWLNALVLSFAFVVILWIRGVMMGWDHQAKNDMTDYEIGGGQYWQEDYDPFDPFSLLDSHAPVPEAVREEIARGDMEPQLLAQGTIYPRGRMLAVTLRGIRPGQTVLKQPTHTLDRNGDAIPAFVGSMMARTARLSPGDRMLLRWRDARGVFDAAEIEIVEVFSSNVPAVEDGQLYLALDRLRDMMGLPEHATLLTFRDDRAGRPALDGWILKTKAELTRQVDAMLEMKQAGQSILYGILLLLAMLAIFDTQVLSIFRRQKEIGTYVALGYTRRQVVGLFTVEGAMHSVLALLLAALYGTPFLLWMARHGITIPMDADQFGIAMAQTLYPVYGTGLVLSTVLLVTVSTVIVSYLPSRRIARMNPTEALRGKLQ